MIAFFPINSAAFEDIVAGSVCHGAENNEFVIVSTGALKYRECVPGVRVISTRLSFVRGRPFHHYPFRNRVRSYALAIEMIRILRSLAGCNLVVLENSAYFHLRVVALWSRRRGVPVALIGVMAADYSDPRWRGGIGIPSLVRHVAKRGNWGFVHIPGLAIVFVACKLLDMVGRISLWFFSHGQQPWGGWGGLSPHYLPLGPVRPDLCLASALGADEEFRKVYGELVEIRTFRDDIGPATSIDRHRTNLTAEPGVLVLVPRVSSILTSKEILLRQLRALSKEIPAGMPVSVRVHPNETPHDAQSLRIALQGGRAAVSVSSGPLWIEARKATKIVALGLSSAGEYVARNFSRKTDWVDAPVNFDAFIEMYRLRPTLLQQLNEICGSKNRLL